MNNRVRSLHRLVSLLFCVAVATIFLILAVGRQPAEWMYFVPLAPLALLTLSGLYLYALPYLMRRRPGRL